jgi:hypothetical protein
MADYADVINAPLDHDIRLEPQRIERLSHRGTWGVYPI